MTTKPKRPQESLPRWQVIIIRKRGQPVGRVQARDAAEAIKIAAEQYGYDPKRLAAARIEQ